MTQDMNNKIMIMTITPTTIARQFGLPKLVLSLRQTPSFLTANSPFAYGGLLRNLLITILFLLTGVSGVWGQSLPDVTTSSETHLYKINLAKNKKSDNYLSTYFMTPSSPNVSIKDNPGNNELWYVIETDETLTGSSYTRDRILHYCYIVNAVSGEYLYYTGTNGNTVETNVVEMSAFETEGAEVNRFKFVIKRSGNGTTPNFCIYPKIAADNNSTQVESNTYGYLALGSPKDQYDNNLTLSKERNGLWTSQWVFTSASLFDAPTITFNNVTNQFTISHSVLSSGCTIYYTTDSSTPSSSWTPYTGAVDVSHSATVRAVVIRDDIVLTEVGSLAVSPAIEAPVITNNFDGTISLSCTTTGALIYYTTDGTTPSSSNGTLYTSAFSLGSATVIKAIAYNSVGTFSSSVTIYDVPQYDEPTISFNSATSQVTISGQTGATIYYTTNGSTPSASNYTGTGTTTVTINNVSSATTIKAIATHAGYLASTVAELFISQVATPVITADESYITITCATEGATIYYTTDGTTPTTNSTEYTGPLVSAEHASEIITAIAVKENCITSDVSDSYTVPGKCEDPIITNTAGSITMSCATEGATIYYTTDDTTPTASSTAYTGAFNLGYETQVLKAIAIKSGMISSTVVTENIPQCPKPTISYDETTDKVTITCEGATIYYTQGVDPADPDITDSSQQYSAPFAPADGAKYLKAIAVKPGYYKSEIETFSYDLGTLYYIQSNKSKTYYMCTSGNQNSNNEKYVKTSTGQGVDAVWRIKETTGGYYIIHYNDDKYMVADNPVATTNSVHLVETDNPNENAIFILAETSSGSGIYTIKPKNADKYLSKGDDGKDISLAASSDDKTQWLLTDIPAKPTFTKDDITFTLTHPLGDAYYTTDGSDPQTSGTSKKYTSKVKLKYGPQYTLKAYNTFTDKDGNEHHSVVVSTTLKVSVIAPIFLQSGNNVTLTNYQFEAGGVKFRYTVSTDGNDPADPTPTSGTEYVKNTALALTDGARNVFKCIAYNTVDGNTYESSVVKFVVDLRGQTEIASLEAIADNLAGNYKLTADVDATGFTSLGNFTGTLDGNNHTITNLSVPIFTSTNDAVISNLMIKKATISGSGNVGAITCVANGNTRIYNCGLLPDDLGNNGSVSGTGDVGSIVGTLNGYSRVINCFSFASVNGGSNTGGIVGNNTYTSKSGDIRTMVMNCMFYGTGSSIYPIYGGNTISNSTSSKLNNYNYFSAKNLPSSNIADYNRALAAEERYLTRFEFYRLLLNSTRELAAWYATGSTDDAHTNMYKWVLDKEIAPYPILKVQGTYPSVINFDPIYTYNEEGEKIERNSISSDEEDRNKGRKLGELTVHISIGTGYPTGASIKEGKDQITLVRTDKDYVNYNFNYDKVQLPYYNEVGIGNCTHNKVVTGWKITSMVGGSQGSYTAGDEWGGYNFADRTTYAKDLFTESGRVFSQGAYFDVPDDVTDITIEPYWGNAAYLSDGYFDSYGYETSKGVADFGIRYTNGSDYEINGNNQPVYTSMSNALARLDNLGRTTSTTVYDNAVVLVGNYHHQDALSNDWLPYTVMSADLDNDNEPDYSLIYNSGKQKHISPIRFDFVNVPGTAMAHKVEGSDYMGIVGNFKVHGWFEVTNTCLIRFSQFEMAYWEKSDNKKHDAPVILQGGVVEQIVSTNFITYANNEPNSPKGTEATQYIHIGGNAWFKLFNNGCHIDKTKTCTPRVPISVTGGDYEQFYLSGYFQPKAPSLANDDAECYISGGRFGEVAGAGQELIDGNVTWDISHADIEYFYGGGINDKKPITGKIEVTIKNSHITGTYCGGPKFGNMATGKTVTTTADDCTFGTYFGAGNGGTAYVREPSFNDWNYLNYNWNTDVVKFFTASDGKDKRGNYNASKGGIAANYEYEHFEGSNDKTVARLYVNYASLSIAQTKNVFSTLTDCTILHNFYGGGNLGSVDGAIISTLTDCKVKGNVFGAGYSATVPTADVFPAEGFSPEPSYNTNTGVFEPGGFPTAVEYTWSNTGSTTNTLTDEGTGTTAKHWIYTDQNVTDLGSVNGSVTLTITTDDGESVIGTANDITTGNVYGGGDESTVKNDTTPANAYTTVNISGNTHVRGNVFGGGNKGLVSGNATVNIRATEPNP